MKTTEFVSSKGQHGAAIPEPPPMPNVNPAIWDLVIEDFKKRDAMGFEKYHTHLQGFNGRDGDWEAYQEELDKVVYMRQKLWEKEKMKELVQFTDGRIGIWDGCGAEIVYWVEDEWVKDPSVVLSICNAIKLVLTDGPQALRDLIDSA